MALGIRPLNDFAFKKIFGDGKNRYALISLLNAILNLAKPIIDVTIQNPFNPQDFAEDKLTVLDIKAVDADGAIYNVEMQLFCFQEMPKRLLFYGCELYAGQLSKGKKFRELKPVFTICLADYLVWPDSDQSQHRFQMMDQTSGRILHDTLEIHVLELRKFLQTEVALANATPIERWVFWLRFADQYDAATLKGLFPEMGMHTATESLETISLKTEDKQMYDSSEKARRDYESLVEEAETRGEARGEARGQAFGVDTGRKKELAKTVHFCQSILAVTQTPFAELELLSADQLDRIATDLQSQVRGRVT